MNLLFPLGLLALLALPIILLLHLIRERRRRVVVPSLLLWQLLPRESERPRPRRLPWTLLLLLHLLAAALLALALAQPQWRWPAPGGERHLAVIVDTSLSMAARDGGVTRLDLARDRVAALISGMGERDSLTLISAGPQPRLVTAGGFADQAVLRAAAESLQAGGAGVAIDEALTLAQASLAGRPNTQILVLSDNAWPTDQLQTTQARVAPVDFRQVGGSAENRAIVAFAARPWNRGASPQLQVYLRVANYGQAPIVTSLRLRGDEQLLEERNLSLNAESETELTWTLPPASSVLRVEIDGRDALPLDDSASLGVTPPRTINVAMVTNNAGALARALQAVPGVQLAIVAPAEYGPATIANADLTIFDGVLPSAWPTGGVLLIDPPPGEGDLLNVEPAPITTRQLSDRTLTVAPETELLADLSLAGVDFGPLRNVTPPEWAQVQLAIGTTPLIVGGHTGRSDVAIWTFHPDQSNLTGRLAFPILVARTVRELTPANVPAALTAGEELVYRPNLRAETIELRGPDSSVQQFNISELERSAGEPLLQITLEQPGIYTLRERQGDTVIYSAAVAVNAGAALESDLRPRPAPVLAAPDRQTVQAASGAGDTIQPLWIWLALAVLAVMVVEWLYTHARKLTSARSRRSNTA